MVLAAVFMVLLTTGCDEQRDLYDTSNTVLHVEGSWAQSLGEPSMLDATVLLYKDGEIKKEFLSRPNGATTRVERGEYDVALFNGIMESETQTNLDHVRFRGSDRLGTFEAYVMEGRPNSRLTRAEGEYIASNEMELFTFSHIPVTIENSNGYYLKYRNGLNGFPDIRNETGMTVEMAPRAMSYLFQVRLTNIVNPRSIRSASAAIRGFVGSVFLPREGERPKPGFLATHHLTLTPPPGSRTRTESGVEYGTLQSPLFVTFGPPMPEDPSRIAASGEYFLDPVFVLTDGSEYRLDEPIDITDQVNEAIERIYEHHSDNRSTDLPLGENLFTVKIEDETVLPPGIGNGGGGGPDISVNPWEDDEVVIIWVGRD